MGATASGFPGELTTTTPIRLIVNHSAAALRLHVGQSQSLELDVSTDVTSSPSTSADDASPTDGLPLRSAAAGASSSALLLLLLLLLLHAADAAAAHRS